jgi:hypothetical protein
VRPRRVSDKRIDAPSTSNPDRAAGFLKADEYRENLRDIHAQQCVRPQPTHYEGVQWVTVERLPLGALGGSLAGDGFLWLHRDVWGHTSGTRHKPVGWLPLPSVD